MIELETCVRAIERTQNRIYEWNFCRNLQARMRRKARAWPGHYDTTGLWKVWSIRAFDDRYTAPHHGFKDAGDYYYRASAMRVIAFTFATWSLNAGVLNGATTMRTLIR